MSSPQRSAEAVARLDAVTRRLRRECPWDREQNERSIVPHTVEEAYELADAAERGDDAKLIDELGDVLFQVHFLALLLEERGAGDMAAVAEHCRQKLIRRHPHVFGEGAEAGPLLEKRTWEGADRPPPSESGAGEGGDRPPPSESDTGEGAGAGPLLEKHSLPSERPRPRPATAGEVLKNWDRIKVEEEGGEAAGPFGEVPENLPSLLYARKVQRRAASRIEETGLAPDALEAAGLASRAIAELEALAAEAGENPQTRLPEIQKALGEALFALVDAARQLRCDPELALRAVAREFRAGHES